ncbi:hypothetical protein HYY75_05735 [bacterium]|nr:hypothetical protein [bacterium]
MRGCLLISSGIHPRIVQDRLLAYLSGKTRIKFNSLDLGEVLAKGGKA